MFLRSELLQKIRVEAKVMRKIAILIIALMLIVTGFLCGCTSNTIKTKDDWSEDDLKWEAEIQIKERLKCPSTAQFSDEKVWIVKEYSSYNEYKVEGKVDAQNSFGAMIRNSFYIYLKCYADGKYIVGEWNIY